MNVLLINPPIREHAPPVHFPLGLAYIATVLRKVGFKITVLDINAHRYSKEEVVAAIQKIDFDIVGIGGMVTVYKYVKWLVPELKAAKPNAKVILGGSLASSIPDFVIEKIKQLDAIVLGEGEITAVELFNALKSNKKPEGILGVWYRDEKKICKNEPRPLIKNIDEVPFPSYDLFPVEVYSKYAAHESGFRKRMNMISTRGCPFGCRFCYHLFGRSMYRTRSPENIIEEIKMLYKDYEIKNISFADDNLTANRPRLIKFCELLANEKLDLTWSCLGRADSIDEEILNLMKAAGCNYIGFGIESGSQKILNNMNKAIKLDTVKKAVELTRKAGIAANGTFIFGYPGEDDSTIRETINFCKELDMSPDFFIITPYPGTPIYYEAIEKGLIKDVEKFVEMLGDATCITINFTNYPDDVFMKKKEEMLRELRHGFLKKAYARYKNVGFQNFFFWAARTLKLTSK